MAEIMVLKGLRYTPEMFLSRMERSKKLQGISIRLANTIYSPCWIFQFRVGLQATKKTRRYAGYYAGFDESVMSPGKIALLPTAEALEVPDHCILSDKLTEEEALQRAWDYNKQAIIRKFRVLRSAPELEDHVTEKYYKPLYIFEFHNLELDEKKYKYLDSLTGDLDDIHVGP